MKLLFICNLNQNRSILAEELFKDKYECRSKGFYRNNVSKEDLLWADIIFVFSDEMGLELKYRFPEESLGIKIINLDISNYYDIQNEESRKLLTKVLLEKIGTELK